MKNTEFKSKKWMRLDNAAKIYPAARKKNWTALFRVSAELSEEVDTDALFEAQRAVLGRMPTFRQRLRKGFFWYYLEDNEGEPDIQEDVANPCVRMDLTENRRFMFRVRCYKNRIAVEFFHVLSDGYGGMCFLRTLVAEYLKIKYGADIPRGNGILDCSEEPKAEEAEDAYIKYARKACRPRGESRAFYIKGEEEEADVVHITTGITDSEELIREAKKYDITVNEYLTATMLLALYELQEEKLKGKKFARKRELKVCVPINLRKFYPTETLRNFAIYVNPGIDSRYGEYTFEETAKAVKYYMGLEATEKQLNARFAPNVRDEQSKILRLTPLFLKNIAMRMTFNMVGDRQTSTLISNLGNVALPEEMEKYVSRMDFILGPLSRNRDVCAVLSYGGKTYMNFTRTIKEPELERLFFTRLVKAGIKVKIESNKNY